MKKNKRFTTPCYMVVKEGNHANRLMTALKSIGDRKVYGMPDNITYPCVCGVSANIVSFGELNDLAGFINCEENGEKWEISYIHSLLELKEYFQLIKFDYSKTHKATAEELIKHFNS